MSSGPCSCVVEPISSLEALLKFSPSSICTHQGHTSLPISTSFSTQKLKLDGSLSPHPPSKLIICHDLKGGYLDDKFVCGRRAEPDNYVFRHWAQTDYFIYFSHHFVTIPPVGWTHAAHLHGVKVLGTIITEWKDGEGICKGFLGDSCATDQVVNQLVNLTVHYGFDGYLLNIENGVEDAECLLTFVRLLRMRLREASPSNILFYYDSVIMDGTLDWQNELNHKNKPFFDACDGLFLNYCWDAEKLAHSVELSGERRDDVYVGVDVFGRNCFGGGGFNTYKALEKIGEFGLSVAIFAPGWTYERFAWEDFLQTDNEVWGHCAPCFGYRALQGSSVVGETEGLRLIFQSSFSLGYGRTKFHYGQEVDDGSAWFDLRETAYQPVLLPLPYTGPRASILEASNSNPETSTSETCVSNLEDSSVQASEPEPACPHISQVQVSLPKNHEAFILDADPEASALQVTNPEALICNSGNPEVSSQDVASVPVRYGGIYETDTGFMGGGCLRLSPAAKPSLWIPLQLAVSFDTSFILLLVWKGQEEPSCSFKIRKTNGQTDTIHVEERQADLILDRRLEVGLDELMAESKPGPDIRFRFGPSTTSTTALNGWTLSACLFESGRDGACGVEGVYVGVDDCSIQLGFMSLAMLNAQ